MASDTQTILEVTETYNAPIGRVYDAWADPEQLKIWFGPGPCEVLETNFTPEAGSEYSIKMQVGDDIVTVRGTFEEVIKEELLSFSWQ
jgi:uncharacterized protein YndB with AHSA1/START domain